MKTLRAELDQEYEAQTSLAKKASKGAHRQFILYASDTNGIVAGGNDKHLDFRVSVQNIRQVDSNRVVVTTAVKFNNAFGHFYLFVIKPFHKLAVKRRLLNAAKAARI